MLKTKKQIKDKKNKSRNKRILTVYSSNNSIGQGLFKGVSLPLKKPNKQSIINHPQTMKEPSKKQKIKPIALKIKSPENYEKVPLYFVNSNTNSQIQFSNYGQTLNGNRPLRKQLYIDCDQQALMKQIWRLDKKKEGHKNRAAIKIQKVFRGYLTRKLLMKYVEQYQQKLLQQQRILKRKNSLTKSRDGQLFSLEQSNSKQMYFPSSKKSFSKDWESGQAHNIDLQQSFVDLPSQRYRSLECPAKQSRKVSVEKSSFILNQSSITIHPQEASLSFGQQGLHSPHFMQPSKNADVSSNQSPFKQSAIKMTHKSDDKTRDGGQSQNISNCPSYSKPNRAQKDEMSRFSSIQKQQIEIGQKQQKHLQQLRSTEKAKWQQVIELVNLQMKEGVNKEKTKQLMSVILQFSVNNRQELNGTKSYCDQAITPSTVTHRQLQSQEAYHHEPVASFKKKKWTEQIVKIDRVIKNENMPLSCKKIDDKSILQRTTNMKQYFLSTLNLQDIEVDKMMQLREAVLRKRQSRSLVQLNDLLQNHQVTQEQFLNKLSQLTHSFQRQKTEIERTKNQIYQGYRAQMQLLRYTMLDARYLGYSIPFCRSMQIFPNHPQWRFDSVMIDELNELAAKKAHRKPRDTQYQILKEQNFESKIDQLLQSHEQQIYQQKQAFPQSESSEESVNFDYQQTSIYNRMRPASIDLYSSDYQNQMVHSPKNIRKIDNFNRFSTIAVNIQNDVGQLLEEERINTSEQKEQKEQRMERRMPKKEIFKIEAQSDEQSSEEIMYKETDQRDTQDLVDQYFTTIIFQFIEQIFMSNRLLQSFNLVQPSHSILRAISKQQKLSFLDASVSSFPDFNTIKEKLNQKMYANIQQLLMSMRQQLLQQSDQIQYYQIGHYEYILNQNLCYSIIEEFIDKYRENVVQSNLKLQLFIKSQRQTITEQQLSYCSEKLKARLFNYKSQVKTRSNSIEQQREQILRMELHLLLDAWNEQLIKYRENKDGYSGIGLNEISQSLVNRVCKPLRFDHEWKQMIVKTKSSLEYYIKEDRLNEKITKQFQEYVCTNDAQWILYTQEGLQFGFDIAKTVEVDLIFELLQELHHLNQNKGQDDVAIDQMEDSQQEVFSLNQEQQYELQKKMEIMQKLNSEDSDESSYE